MQDKHIQIKFNILTTTKVKLDPSLDCLQLLKKTITLPPNESLSNLVSFESRTGTCALFSARAFMHLPNALSERLMDLASSNICPSLPAKINNFAKNIFGEKRRQNPKEIK